MENKNSYLERASYDWSEDSIRLLNTPSQTARAIYFYVQEVGHFKTFYPYFTERANLNSFLIALTLSGSGKLQYEGKEYNLTKGDCFFIDCMKKHSYQTPKGETWEFLWIHFYGSNALGYYEEFCKNEFRILNNSENSQIEDSLRSIITITQKRDITTEVKTSGFINSILTELIVRNSTNQVSTILIPGFVKYAAKYIDQNFKEQITLEKVSHLSGVSRFYLSKEFKRYIGITFNDYLIGARISYAKELLKYSELSVNEITYSCGMNHVSHFINLFKAREFMTPHEYRKKWKD
jgi:AraC-like DNA-binding protein